MDHDADLPELSSLEGELLGGKYVVESVLGDGGMGIVFRARAVDDGHSVAIKVLRSELVSSEEAVARFDREARALFALTSAHVARVFDVGRTSEGAPYLVMEHLVGKSLAAMVAEHTLGVTATLDLALEVCEALTEAHARGIIHRDLKPANVFMVDSPDGRRRAKVLDFGIAKIQGTTLSGESLTTTGSMIGTPWYMPPEQLDTRLGVTPKADVWSLGATLYNALTGRTPYEAESFFELSVKVYTHEPTPIERHRGDLPSDVVAFVHACLKKDVAKRLSLAAAVAELRRLRGLHSSLDAVFVASPGGVEGVEMSTAPTVVAPHTPAPDALHQLTSTRRMPRPADAPVPASAASAPLLVAPAAGVAPRGPSAPGFATPAPSGPTAGRIGAAIGLSAAAVLAVTLLVVRLRHSPEPSTPSKEVAAQDPTPVADATASAVPVASAPLAPSASSAPSAALATLPSSSPTSASPTSPSPRATGNGRRPGVRPPSTAKPDPSQNNGALTHER